MYPGIPLVFNVTDSLKKNCVLDNNSIVTESYDDVALMVEIKNALLTLSTASIQPTKKSV